MRLIYIKIQTNFFTNIRKILLDYSDLRLLPEFNLLPRLSFKIRDLEETV